MPRKRKAQEAAPSPKVPPPEKTAGKRQFARKPSGHAWEPKPGDRLLVRLGSAAGMTQDQVANALQVDVSTLRKYCASEWHEGQTAAHLQVVGNLFRIATQTQDNKAALTAAIWWTKARLGWKGDTAANVEAKLETDAPVKFTLKIGDRDGGSD